MTNRYYVLLPGIYGNSTEKNYRVVSTKSAREALNGLEDFKKKGQTLALMVVDQRMPEMLGVDFIKEARQHFPEAKRTLLTAYSDTDAAIRAINEVQLDYYFVKPWGPARRKAFSGTGRPAGRLAIGLRAPPTRGLRLLGISTLLNRTNLKIFWRAI